jgi:hypothetical protein
MSSHGSPIANVNKTNKESANLAEKPKSMRHSRRKSECSTPFLDTVFSGGLAKNSTMRFSFFLFLFVLFFSLDQSRESNTETGPNWDDLALEDTSGSASSSSSSSNVKHSGRRRTIHGISKKK